MPKTQDFCATSSGRYLGRILCCAAVLICGLAAKPNVLAEDHQPFNPEARAIFKELIEINTTESSGSVTKAAEAMAVRLRDAGFAEKDVIVAGPNDRKKNLVARL